MNMVQCPTVAHDTVCLEAQVKIIPEVKIGKVIVKCKGDPFIGRCPGTPQKACSFFVSQRIDVDVPLTFSADVFAEPTGIVCGEPEATECDEHTHFDEECECK